MNKFHYKAIILIFLAGIIVYANSLSNPFIWDDEALVRDNFLIKDWRYIGKLFTTDLYYSASHSNFYRPLQSLSYMFDYSLWRLNPAGFHFTNIILHIAVAILAYILSVLLSENKILSLITALLFVVHPVHTEAITYIAGRADPLMGLFLLSSFILFIKYINADSSNRRCLYLGSLACFLYSLFCKEAALIFPFALLLTKLKFVRKEAKVNLLSFLPFFIIAGFYALFRFNLVEFGSGQFFASEYPFKIRLFIILKVVATYLGLLVLPINLHMSRNVTLPQSFFDLPIFASFLLLVLILIFALRCYRRAPLAFLACAWFFLFLIPQSGLFPINAFLAEHFLYLPSLGFFLLASFYLVKLFSRKRLIFVLVPILAFYSFLSIKRNLEWRNPLSFYKKMIELSPYSFAGYNQLGLIYLREGLYDKAIKAYDTALEINEDFSEAYVNRTIAYYLNRTIAYYKNGRQEEALKESLRLVERYPDCDFVHGGLAGIYADNKEYEKAVGAYNEAIRIAPQRPKFYNCLGLVYNELGKFDLAIEQFKKGIAIDNKDAVLHNNLGVAYKQKGQLELAIAEYHQAIKLTPDFAEGYNNLGIVCSKIGQYAQARRYFKRAIQLDPDYCDAHYNLGVVYWKNGQGDKSRREWEKVLQLEPEHELAKKWLRRAKNYGGEVQDFIH